MQSRAIIIRAFSSSASICDPAIIRASPVVLSMWTLHKYLLHPSLVIYLFFSNPTHKTRTATASWWETTNSNSPGPIKLSTQSAVGVRLCCAFSTSLNKLCKNCWAKTILLSQTGMFFRTFLHRIVICRVT